MQTEHNLLQKEVLSSVFSTVLKDTAKSNVVKYLWRVNPCLTLGGFVEAHSDRKCLLRIADLCQQLQVCTVKEFCQS
jgi:CCR4-NOT transcription complex subunit 1